MIDKLNADFQQCNNYANLLTNADRKILSQKSLLDGQKNNKEAF